MRQLADDIEIVEPPLNPESPFNPEILRRDFPVLQQSVNGNPLVYLDNAATTQKPRAVIERMKRYYEEENANVHRGVHTLSQRATDAYEDAREKIRAFIHAAHSREIVFVRGATEAINLAAWSFGQQYVRQGDEIVISALEHHSNIVPWQMLCERAGARLNVIPMNRCGELDMNAYVDLLGERTRLVAVVHISNALGTVNPVKEIIAQAHARGIPVLVDGAQSVPHMPIDVQELQCDFFAFSGHKMYGPTGIGVLYGRGEMLEKIPPYQGGGDMIRSVTFAKTTFNDIPYKFEAGTPNIAGAIGLGAAVDYLTGIGMDNLAAHEKSLLEYAGAKLAEVEGLTVYGTAKHKAAAVSFLLGDIHPHDIGTILDQEGIAIRTGHHCAQPVMDFFTIPATARASFGLYNTRQDIHRLVQGLEKIKEVFS
jgi:cysteine desulfurase/selenocysteine lyase